MSRILTTSDEVQSTFSNLQSESPCRIVICAFAADPTIPSEPTIGWAFVKSALKAAAGSDAKVILLTNPRSAAAMARWAEEDPAGCDLEIVSIGLGPGMRWLERPRINALARLEYLLWYFKACIEIRHLSRNLRIVLAHHVTFATEMLPTPISFAGGEAFKVWGPIGSDGSADVYRIHPMIAGTRREYFIQRVRDALSWLISPVMAKDVDLVITSQQGSLYRRLVNSGVSLFTFPNLVMADQLIDEIVSSREVLEPASKADNISIMCVGHLIPRKRFELGIAALAEPGLELSTLNLFGRPTGGDLSQYQALASRLGVADRVVFHGSVPRSAVLKFMSTADVLFHPAGREGAVGVIGEATTSGIPVVCFEGTGAALVLRAARGNGIEIDPSEGGQISKVAEALLNAASMSRGEPARWGSERFDELERLLIEHALGRELHPTRKHRETAPELRGLRRILDRLEG